jgi:hypothetical protein
MPYRASRYLISWSLFVSICIILVRRQFIPVQKMRQDLGKSSLNSTKQLD